MRWFFSQERVDAWGADGTVAIDGETITFVADRRRFRYLPAVRFLRLVEGQDAAGLVGRVKSEDVVRGLGGEPYGGSVILGETAYDVQPGILAEPA